MIKIEYVPDNDRMESDREIIISYCDGTDDLTTCFEEVMDIMISENMFDINISLIPEEEDDDNEYYYTASVLFKEHGVYERFKEKLLKAIDQ